MRIRISNLGVAFLCAFSLIALLDLSGCRTKEGCTDPQATNYNPDAEIEDSTCVYPDPCNSVVCAHGTCDAGLCDCEEGYYGTQCDLLYADLYAGNYTVVEFCLPDTHNYTCTVWPDGSDITQILFSGLYAQSHQVYAVLDTTVLTIPLQPFGNDQIGGSGNLDTLNHLIHLDYSIITGGPTEFCNATLNRQ